MIPGDILTRIPGCEDGQPPQVMQPLAGGRGCNAVWRIETTRGWFVLRMRGEPVDRPGSRARNELAAHRIAAAAGLAPALLDAADDGRWLLMEHVSGKPWNEAWLQSAWGLDALGRCLRELHCLSPPSALRPVDPVAIAAGYVEQAAMGDPGRLRELEPQVRAVEAAAAQLSGTNRLVLNHGDLQAANLLGPAPVLVDWEYSQCADPTWDLACLLEYYPGLKSRRHAVLEACGMDPAADGEILSCQEGLFARLNALWSLTQPGAG